jgi:FlaA1/EpsC-like NDP-sugar epimerase
VAELQRQAIPVLQIPSVHDLTSGRARIDALRPVFIEDLLGRDPVPPVTELLGQKGFQGASSSPWGMG